MKTLFAALATVFAVATFAPAPVEAAGWAAVKYAQCLRHPGTAYCR